VRISRRKFLSLIPILAGGVLADAVFAKGFIRESILKFITNREYREKVINKILSGDFAEEFEQGISDRSNERLDAMTLGEVVNITEEYFDLFLNVEIRELLESDRLVLIAEMDDVEILVTLKNNGILDIQRTLDERMLILPHTQLTSDPINDWKPALYTAFNTPNGVVEYMDNRTNNRNPRDGGLVVDNQGTLQVVDSSKIQTIEVGSRSENAQAIITFPFTVQGDSVNLGGYSSQLEIINRPNETILGATELADSPRYETFYVTFTSSQNIKHTFLISTYQINNSQPWESRKRLTMRNMAQISKQLMLERGDVDFILVPTDPDINDGVYYTNGPNPLTQGALNKETDGYLQRSPLYLTT